MEFLEALRRLRGTAEKAARRAAFWAPLLAAALGGAPSARAASSARLNIDIDIQAISPITDLTAVSGASSGTISLSWTEPFHSVGTPPYSYDVRASTVAQIADDVAFSTNSLLSVFSPSVVPAPGAGGGAAGFVVSGLTPNVTYYFAMREKDSTTFKGVWSRTVSPPRNVNNFAAATSFHPAVSSGAFSAVGVSSLTMTWAAAAGATDYTLVASTVSVSPPTAVAASSATASSTATLTGLFPNTTYFLFVTECGGGGGCSGYTALGSTVTFAAPAVGLSTNSVSSSTVVLAWNADGNPSGTPYAVQRSTDGVAFVSVATVTTTGATVAGLIGGVTYYFQVVALSFDGTPAPPSNTLTLVTPTGPTPSTPAGLLARSALLGVSLSWDALPPAQQGVGLDRYLLLRSTNAGFGYAQVAATAGLTFTDAPLAAGATFYYKLIAKALDGAVSAPSAAVSASPFNYAPMEPIGVTVAPSSAAVTFQWSPVRRFIEGSPFLSTGTPVADELGGYKVYRSTDICTPSYSLVATLPSTTTALTDASGGANYYYHLLAFNTAGASQNGATISSLGERGFFVDDCKSVLTLDDKTADTLVASGNGAGTGAADVRVVASRRPQDVGAGVYQSVQWRAYRDGGAELKGFTLPKPARIVLHFDVAAGSPVADTAPVSGFAPAAVPAAGGAVSPADLGAYWYNGVQWVKMYGRVDTLAQTVTLESPNLGVYQVRAQARAAGAVFDVSNLASRVITPNGDGRNDTLIFAYDPGPKNVLPEGKVFDLQGSFVADMTPGLVPNTLTWNGFMNGAPARGGVYVYRITGDGKVFTGTIVVAR